MRRTKQEAEQTRRRIMSAALRTFDRHGISRTTMEHIADAAGVTRGAIYWHFADKQALLAAIRDDRDPTCSGYHGLKAVEMAHGVFEAGLKHARVKFPLENRKHPLTSIL